MSFVSTRLDVTSQVLFKWHLSNCAIFTVENFKKFLHKRTNGIQPYEVAGTDSENGLAEEHQLFEVERITNRRVQDGGVSKQQFILHNIYIITQFYGNCKLTDSIPVSLRWFWR